MRPGHSCAEDGHRDPAFALRCRGGQAAPDHLNRLSANLTRKVLNVKETRPESWIPEHCSLMLANSLPIHDLDYSLFANSE
jgi:hypothetical protein